MSEPQRPAITGGQTPLWLRRTVVAGLLGGLLLAGFVVMRPFLSAIAWAGVLTYVSWPLHLRLLARLRGRRTWAALAMTLLLTLALGVTLIWLGLLLRGEGVAAVREAAALLQAGVRLPEPMLRIPWLGPWLQALLVELSGDRAAWGRQLSELTEQWGGYAIRIVGDLGLNALRFGVSLLTAFFLFRNGDRLLAQLRHILHGLLGDRVRGYFTAVGDTTRAVVYGLLLAAFAQGLLLWGALAVSWIDNLVRSLVISGVAKIPFLLVLFGVLGGRAAFGLIGLFVGPVMLAILLALGREWSTVNAGRLDPSAP